ncbi:hypothetical protein F4782DRAFT_502761 [Xylaria castorea]|nr:hypothetical protein F4782DRAFT_502761 [Xylaria castorea]
MLRLELNIDGCVRMSAREIETLVPNDSRIRLDMSLWILLFAFDCLGELSASKKSDFLESGHEIDGMIEGSDRVLIKTGLVRTRGLSYLITFN